MARRGCLSFILPVGRAPAPRALPIAAQADVHPRDRAAFRKAVEAAEGALAAIQGPGTPDLVVDDLTSRLAGLVGALGRLAADLARARRFLDQHHPDALARARAELEIRQMTATADQIRPMRDESAALLERAALARRVEGELGALEARLAAAGQELQAFRARVEARTSAEELSHELEALHRAAEAAFEAFDRTRRELG